MWINNLIYLAKRGTVYRSAIASIQSYLREIAKVPLLSKQEEEDYARRIAEGDDRARTEIIKANLRLVVKIAKKYINRGLPFMDLVQEGNLGLIKAINKYDINRGCRFSTYATWWIRQKIARALLEKASTIRVPVHIIETINTLLKNQNRLIQKKKRNPEIFELAESMNMSEKKVRVLLNIKSSMIPFEKCSNEPINYNAVDYIEDTHDISPLDKMINENLVEQIKKGLETLTDVEKKIVEMRFGLRSGKVRTLADIGDQYHLSRERIRQIQNEALNKLKELRESIFINMYSN